MSDISTYAASIDTSKLQAGTAAAINTLITAVQAASYAPAVMPLLQLVGQLASEATVHGL